mgnify:CR=1 FL=1
MDVPAGAFVTRSMHSGLVATDSVGVQKVLHRSIRTSTMLRLYHITEPSPISIFHHSTIPLTQKSDPPLRRKYNLSQSTTSLRDNHRQASCFAILCGLGGLERTHHTIFQYPIIPFICVICGYPSFCLFHEGSCISWSTPDVHRFPPSTKQNEPQLTTAARVNNRISAYLQKGDSERRFAMTFGISART